MYKKGFLCVLVCIMVLMTSCAKKSDEKVATTNSSEASKKLVFVVTGQLGDKSFNDSANRGVQEVASTLGYETKVIEIGREQTKWLPTFEDLADSNEYDIIITNGSNAGELITTEVAPNFPDQKFILFDTTIDDSNDNVYAMSYRQNEASYLAGVLAAMVTKSDMEFANSEKKIGFIGGSECPIISDFLVGYIEGAKSVDPEITCYVSYIGSWDDSAKGKETAIAQFNQGVDITFPAAEQAGLGCVDAALDMGKYIIGVDSDQAMLFDESAPDKANIILTSVLKQVDKSIVRAVKNNDNGILPWGTYESLGLAEGGVGLADNKYYQSNVPQNIKDAVVNAKETIDNGNVSVMSALTDSPEAVQAVIDSVAPQN
ncbi:MAG: BMP family ABC transporter substrate-binding protein [Pleomorphochaeta sp.]